MATWVISSPMTKRNTILIQPPPKPVIAISTSEHFVHPFLLHPVSMYTEKAASAAKHRQQP
jgi:hypothetical protein